MCLGWAPPPPQTPILKKAPVLFEMLTSMQSKEVIILFHVMGQIENKLKKHIILEASEKLAEHYMYLEPVESPTSVNIRRNWPPAK